jgi:CBS-domain-containing membrane protein
VAAGQQSDSGRAERRVDYRGVRIVLVTSTFVQHDGRVGWHINDDDRYRDLVACGSGESVADAMVTCPTTHGLDTAVDEIRAFFADDHVHMALIVAAGQRLVTTIERADLPASSSGLPPAAELGTLTGRTVSPSAALDAVTAALLRDRRRRLAVVDDRGRLLGLLCLKKSCTGYCSDGDVRERAGEAGRLRG